jgi:RimJ/RimL family protein N-acetyltransferase
LFEYEKKIKELKENNSDIFSVPYTDGTNIIVNVVDNSTDTISLLAKWRNEYGDWFDTKFEMSFDKTKEWVNNKIIKDIQRILFLIIHNNQKIGQIGLDWYDKRDNSIFITDVIRGERGFAPGLMSIVFNQFIIWIRNELGISVIKLRVFQDDVKAISLYEKCGFKKIDSISMKKQLTNDGWKWIKIDSVNQIPERFFDIMEFR